LSREGSEGDEENARLRRHESGEAPEQWPQKAQKAFVRPAEIVRAPIGAANVSIALRFLRFLRQKIGDRSAARCSLCFGCNHLFKPAVG